MKAFVLVHGSWHTGEAWIRVKDLLESAGASVHTPTLSGMESSANPGGPDVGLGTHVEDIVRLIETEDLRDVVLVGHSYSGLVTTSVADRIPGRVATLVFLDAFIPDDNQSLFDIMGHETETNMRSSLVDAAGRSVAEGADEVWLLPPGDAAFYLGEDADPADVEWLQQRLVYKPVATFAEKVRLSDIEAVRALPSVYIECTGFPYLTWVADKARGLGWPVHQIDSGHDAMVSKPVELSALLLEA